MALFDDIAQTKEIAGLDSFFGRFPDDCSLCDFVCDVVAEKDFWPRLKPTAEKIADKIGAKRKLLLRAIRDRSKTTVLRAKTEKYIATSRFRFDLNYVPAFPDNGGDPIMVNSSQKQILRSRGRKRTMVLVGFDPHIFYQHGPLHVYFSMFAGMAGVTPHYVVANHLLDRMKRLPEFSATSREDIRFFVLGQLSTRLETLKPYWQGRGNEVMIRSEKGAFLGEALIVDTPDGPRKVYFLKTFVAEFQLFKNQKNPDPRNLLDTHDHENVRSCHYRLAQEFPYNDGTDMMDAFDLAPGEFTYRC